MTAQQQQQLLMQRAMEIQNHQQLDKSRVALLLDINVELLKETVNIQGMSKSTGVTDGASGPNEIPRDPVNEKVYQEYVYCFTYFIVLYLLPSRALI